MYGKIVNDLPKSTTEDSVSNSMTKIRWLGGNFCYEKRWTEERAEKGHEHCVGEARLRRRDFIDDTEASGGPGHCVWSCGDGSGKSTAIGSVPERILGLAEMWIDDDLHYSYVDEGDNEESAFEILHWELENFIVIGRSFPVDASRLVPCEAGRLFLIWLAPYGFKSLSGEGGVEMIRHNTNKDGRQFLGDSEERDVVSEI
nr:hypothetical protein Iba_chr02bCG2910 [Ipomoea batatas]